MYFIQFSAHHNDKNQLHKAVREKLKPFHNTLALSLAEVLPAIEELVKTENETHSRCRAMEVKTDSYFYRQNQEIIRITNNGFEFTLALNKVQPSPIPVYQVAPSPLNQEPVEIDPEKIRFYRFDKDSDDLYYVTYGDIKIAFSGDETREGNSEVYISISFVEGKDWDLSDTHTSVTFQEGIKALEKISAKAIEYPGHPGADKFRRLTNFLGTSAKIQPFQQP